MHITTTSISFTISRMDSIGSTFNDIAFYYFDIDLHFGVQVHHFGKSSVVTAIVSISFHRTFRDQPKLLSKFTSFLSGVDEELYTIYQWSSTTFCRMTKVYERSLTAFSYGIWKGRDESLLNKWISSLLLLSTQCMLHISYQICQFHQHVLAKLQIRLVYLQAKLSI